MKDKRFDEFFNNGKVIQKIPIIVPDYVRYISDWKEFEYPTGHLILDKVVCGCGFTEYCLSNNIPTILCAPRKVLLENKKEQHSPGKKYEDYPIYYFKNEGNLPYDEDSNDKKPKQFDLSKLSDVEKQEHLIKLKEQLKNYLSSGFYGKAGVPKIVVTYDSLPYVMDTIVSSFGKEALDSFSIVVDEFQAIFMDATFKPEVELTIVETLKNYNVPNVLYLSATPYMSRYLSVVDYINTLPFYELVWGDERVESVYIDRRYSKSLCASCSDLIQDYLDGNYPTRLNENKRLEISTELVLFVNSVSLICDIIKRNKLTPDQCNIICSRSSGNQTKLNSLSKFMSKAGIIGKDDFYCIGKVPTEYETSKMFTFCTRTAYLGADFYSDNALSVVCSDINIKTLNNDINLDLPQIAGRQRMGSNLFKDTIILFYRSKGSKQEDITEEEFFDNEDKKEQVTKDLISLFEKGGGTESESLAETIQHLGINNGFNYAGVVEDKITKTLKVVRNQFLKAATMRAYEISRPEFQEKVLIRKDSKKDYLKFVNNSVSLEFEDFLVAFELKPDFIGKMKMLCDYVDANKIEDLDIFKARVSPEYLDYIRLLGTKKIRALGYQKSKISTVFSDSLNIDFLDEIVYSTFKIGGKYLLKDIKDFLAEIYNSNKIDKVPKASDLFEWFSLKSILITTDGKRNRGYEIIEKLK